jgi:hypothetical protein
MRDSPLDLSRFVDATPGPTPEVRERLAARLQMLIESEQVGDKQPHGRWQRASWTHRAVVIAVAAAIVVVFFVPLPHVSLFPVPRLGGFSTTRGAQLVRRRGRFSSIQLPSSALRIESRGTWFG